MALAPSALCTLAELKAYIAAKGSGADDALEDSIVRASQDIEESGVNGRRLIYRAPIEDDDAVMASATLADGASAPAIAGQPDSDGRTLVATLTDADHSLKGGTLTVTGTVGGVALETETFDLSTGNELHGVRFFTAVSALDLADVSGARAADSLKVGTSEGYTELFSPDYTSEIQPLEWPIRNVAELNEDLNRTFGSTTALSSSQYELRDEGSPRRRVARVSSGLDFAFYAGHRIVQLRYSAGYRAGNVPSAIKGVCLELAAWHHQHAGRQEYGMTSQSDGLGSRSFSGPPMLSRGLLNRLSGFVRPEFELTADRAWSESA